MTPAQEWAATSLITLFLVGMLVVVCALWKGAGTPLPPKRSPGLRFNENGPPERNALPTKPPAAPPPPPPKRVQVFLEDGTELTDLRGELQEIKKQLQLTKASEKALMRRAMELAADWPHIYKRYFTKYGEADRAAHRRTVTNFKPKRKSP